VTVTSHIEIVTMDLPSYSLFCNDEVSFVCNVRWCCEST